MPSGAHTSPSSGAAKRSSAEEGPEEAKKGKAGGGEGGDRGIKRATHDWESFAKMSKESAEKRAEESASPGAGMNIDSTDVVE